MKCYECKWLDRSVILTSNPPQYGCTLGFGSHYADHECEYDFMPIVRCKDCIHWEKTNIETIDGHPTYDCPFCGEWADANGYCSFGELAEQTDRPDFEINLKDKTLTVYKDEDYSDLPDIPRAYYERVVHGNCGARMDK